MKHSNLTESIKSLYPNPIADAEANDAASNLLSFFELLIEIDREHGITSPKQHKGQP
jgi:hypothetical protein